MSVRQILRDFSGWTSAHGIPHIGASKSTCVQIFWTVAFVASACMFTWQVHALISKFIRFDVIVNTELKSDDRSFPAITICNINPFKARRSKITNESAPEMYALVDAYKRRVMGKDIRVDGIDKFGFMRYVTMSEQFNATLNETSTVTNSTALVALQRRARDQLMLIGAKYERNPDGPTKIDDIAWSIEEVVESCSFGRTPLPDRLYNDSTNKNYIPPNLTCDRHKDFDRTFDASYGVCYSFNNRRDVASRKSSFAGPDYGLRLVLKSAQDEYLELTESAGMRLAVHPVGEEAFVDSFGFNAAAGFTTSFSMKYIHTQRLGPPYGECTEKAGSDVDFYYNASYSTEGCYRSCLQNVIIEKCKCADPRYAVPAKAVLCTAADMHCLAGFSIGEDATVTFDPQKQCKCPQICSESTYGVTVATASWPSQRFQVPEEHLDLTDPKGASCRPSATNTGWNAKDNHERLAPCRAWWRTNSLQVQIYWERLNFEMLYEKPSYSLLSMVSDFGGMAGLWMGVSVITFVEVLSLLLLLCLYACRGGAPKEADNEPQKEEDTDSEVDPYEFGKTEYGIPPSY